MSFSHSPSHLARHVPGCQLGPSPPLVFTRPQPSAASVSLRSELSQGRLQGLARPVGAPSSGFFCVLSEGILDTASAGLFFVSQKNLVTGHTPSANTDRKSYEFIHVCVWMPATVCMWEAEDTWEVSWLSPSTMCPGTWWKAGTVTRGAIMPAPHFVILR